ncbi:MAG TPA: class I SAM-dependent methyltransferase [Kiritimatiellia bacterium]|nr:class I SAM-dependent methyltransferase [Kiritimatiellia bacterium]
MATTSTRFDEKAADWDANPARVALARAIVAEIRTAVPLRSDMTVLDVGAGTGLVSLALLPFVREITAVDASSGMLGVLEEKARSHGIMNLFPMHCDVAKAELPPDRYDLVISSMTLHHLSDVPLVLRRLRHALREGGWIALADLDAEDGSFHADPTGIYHHGFERATVSRWLGETGFTDSTSREAYRITRPGADGVMRTYPVFLVTARAV